MSRKDFEEFIRFGIAMLLGFILALGIIFGLNVLTVWAYEPADIVLIGKVVNHEAKNESELGQRLVIDTILNRVESDKFPNTVYDVIHQPGQYCDPDEYAPRWMYSLIAQEMVNRTNDKVLWYRTKKYHTYGTPLLVEGAHYFSGGE